MFANRFFCQFCPELLPFCQFLSGNFTLFPSHDFVLSPDYGTISSDCSLQLGILSVCCSICFVLLGRNSNFAPRKRIVVGFYKKYSEFLSEYFDGKVQKIAVNGGFGCPNRDGSVGTGGCTYCNNEGFSPSYCHPATLSIRSQLEKGIEFFGYKYPAMNYLAYFQTFTNTYAPVDVLRERYDEALAVEKVMGLVISTRPDCLGDDVLELLHEYAEKTFVMLELGVESMRNETLRRINRGHTIEQSENAVRRAASCGIHVGVHTILGLPGEVYEDFIHQADILSQWPIETVKLHQLQIVKSTRMAQDFEQHPDDFKRFTPESYADVAVDFIEHLRKDIAIERFTSQMPPEMLATEGWGIKNHEFLHILERKWKIHQDRK